MQRDLLKTASFALLHFGVAFTIAYLMTGSVRIAAGLGLIEPMANTIAFFFHERLWARLGRTSSGSHTAFCHCRCAPVARRTTQS